MERSGAALAACRVIARLASMFVAKAVLGLCTTVGLIERLKDDFGGRHIRVRGSAKVMPHLMFGILALTADQLLRLLT